jgi:hypothetical protein
MFEVYKGQYQRIVNENTLRMKSQVYKAANEQQGQLFVSFVFFVVNNRTSS